VKYKSYVFPKWAEYIGWCIALSSILAIPIYAIYLFAIQTGSVKEVKNNKRKYFSCLISRFVISAMDQNYNTNNRSKSIS
jgi:amino acid transporter